MSPRRRGRQDGFTLVETLIAVAVVAAVAVALQRGFVSTRMLLARSEAIVAAETLARDILENRLPALASEPGERRIEEDGLVAVVTSEPLDLPFPPARRPAARPSDAGRAERDRRSRRQEEQRPTDGRAAADPVAGGDDPTEAAGRWAPLRVTIRVTASNGPPLVVETVRAAPAS